MEKIRAILVDDEERARDVLENLLHSFCPQVELVGKCANVPAAVEMIREQNPDLVFLDIEMPNYAGFELVKFFEEVNFSIVFVTAYEQHALRAFEVAAVDYLLKPVDIERLKEAVARVNLRRSPGLQAARMKLLSNTLEEKQIKNIIITDRGEQRVIALDEIVAIEAHESYSEIITGDRTITASKNLKHFETLFEGRPEFFRVHKSWIINLQYLDKYSKTDMLVSLRGGVQAKLSKYKLAEFEEAVSRR